MDPPPNPNPRVVSSIKEADVITYASGSLYTSLWPLLVPNGIYDALKASKADKLFFVNGWQDRETLNMRFIINHLWALPNCSKEMDFSAICTHLVCLEAGHVRTPMDRLVHPSDWLHDEVQQVLVSGEFTGSGMRYIPNVIGKLLCQLWREKNQRKQEVRPTVVNRMFRMI